MTAIHELAALVASQAPVSPTSKVGIVLLAVITICGVYDVLVVQRIRDQRRAAEDERDAALRELERLERRHRIQPWPETEPRQLTRARTRARTR